jgi:hypothetical protein
MAEALKFWDGSSWVTVAFVVRMIQGSLFPPGLYGTTGEPLLLASDLSASNMITPITTSETVSLITDEADSISEDLSAISMDCVSAPTISVVLA